MRIIGIGMGTIALLWLLWFFGLPLFYIKFPEFFGHYHFYTSCKSLRPGMTLEEVRIAMAPALEVGRTWQPPDALPAGLMSATAMGVDETAAEHNLRILFIPNAKDFADWCIVYPENGKVARVDISPD
jgi:hypothetical protein